MILEMYSVYDSIAKTYGNPFYCLNDEIAIRNFTFAANDFRSSISKQPESYTLHHVGSFDDDTGNITPLVNHALRNAVEVQDETLQKKLNTVPQIEEFNGEN